MDDDKEPQEEGKPKEEGTKDPQIAADDKKEPQTEGDENGVKTPGTQKTGSGEKKDETPAAGKPKDEPVKKSKEDAIPEKGESDIKSPVEDSKETLRPDKSKMKSKEETEEKEQIKEGKGSTEVPKEETAKQLLKITSLPGEDDCVRYRFFVQFPVVAVLTVFALTGVIIERGFGYLSTIGTRFTAKMASDQSINENTRRRLTIMSKILRCLSAFFISFGKELREISLQTLSSSLECWGKIKNGCHGPIGAAVRLRESFKQLENEGKNK